MSTDTILSEIEPIFRDVLDQPELHLAPETTAADVDGWDSLAHVDLVSAVELHYKIRFALGELQGLKSVGDMCALVAKKLGRS